MVETGLDRAIVDGVLVYLWREDRIECRAMRSGDGREILMGIRRVLEGRERRWGSGAVPAWSVGHRPTARFVRGLPVCRTTEVVDKS